MKLSKVDEFITEWGECLTDAELKQFIIDLGEVLACLNGMK